MTKHECLDCGHHWTDDEPPAEIDRRHLPDEFWNARETLTHIRAAAHARLVSADAVLVGVLARVAMFAPPTLTLPAIVGGRVSLNLFGAVIDPSGGGKSASVEVARQLLPNCRKDIIDPILPGSGEGLIEAFFEWVEEVGDDGKKRKTKQQTKRAGLAYVDEGQALLAQGDRSGSTIMETFRSAWMGGDLGQHNASEERKRWLKAHSYRLSMIVGFQLSYAASMIADAEGGTPQRFTFALATDPSLNPDHDWPGPLPFTQPAVTGHDDVDFEPSIVADIRQRRLLRSRGELETDPLDTHADLRRMKLAAAVAGLEGRRNVDLDDWALAGQIDAMSCAVRTYAIETDRLAQRRARDAAVAHAVEREATLETASITRAIHRCARNVARKVWRSDGPLTPSQAFKALNSRDRRNVEMDDVIDVAVDREWVARRSDGDVERGVMRP